MYLRTNYTSNKKDMIHKMGPVVSTTNGSTKVLAREDSVLLGLEDLPSCNSTEALAWVTRGARQSRSSSGQ